MGFSFVPRARKGNKQFNRCDSDRFGFIIEQFAYAEGTGRFAEPIWRERGEPRLSDSKTQPCHYDTLSSSSFLVFASPSTRGYMAAAGLLHILFTCRLIIIIRHRWVSAIKWWILIALNDTHLFKWICHLSYEMVFIALFLLCLSLLSPERSVYSSCETVATTCVCAGRMIELENM